MISIVPYQKIWSSEFREMGSILRQGLGDLALRIDHIGSTSVPGLDAKDIIDIQVAVSSLDDRVLSAMLTFGCPQVEGVHSDHHPPGVSGAESEWEKWLFKEPAGHRRFNIHVRVEGRLNQRYALLFRDYLRVHPATAEAYARLKRMLAIHLADPETYPDVKDPAVDLIYLAAQDWASITGWRPGASDA